MNTLARFNNATARVTRIKNLAGSIAWNTLNYPNKICKHKSSYKK